MVKDKRITVNLRVTDNFSKKLRELSSYLKSLSLTMRDSHISIRRLDEIVSDLEKELAELSTKADKIDELFEIKIEDEGGHE